MTHWVYILRSRSTGSYYVGAAEDVDRRLFHHNAGLSPYTRGKGPWEVVYTEQYATKREALLREKQIKRMKSSAYIGEMIRGSSRS